MDVDYGWPRSIHCLFFLRFDQAHPLLDQAKFGAYFHLRLLWLFTGATADDLAKVKSEEEWRTNCPNMYRFPFLLRADKVRVLSFF